MALHHLKGLSLTELQDFVQSVGERKFRAGQLFSWIYGKGALSADDMTDLSSRFRDLLSKTASFSELELTRRSESRLDQTTKFLFRLNDGLNIESVLIPPDTASPNADRRLTVCISTQVGCPLDCAFCATGTMDFGRNLTAGEIVDQVLHVRRLARRRLTNVVFMGMGEPMLNYDNVMKAADILTDEKGPAIGARHITISTAGYVNQIRRMADERRKFKLALSLHSLDEEKRTMLMPITKKFGIEELVDSLDYYYRTTRRRPTIEYIVFEGFNNSDDDLRRLAKLAKKIPCKINLIPYHSIDFVEISPLGKSLKPATRSRIEEFAEALRSENVTVMIRTSAGEDIEAACGQLAAVERRQAEARDGGAEIVRPGFPA